MTCNVQVLLTQAACFASTPNGEQAIDELSLLCSWARGTTATCEPLSPMNSGFAGLSPGERKVVKISLLCRILNGVTAACDIQTLLTEGKCYAALPLGFLEVLEAQLLCDIASA